MVRKSRRCRQVDDKLFCQLFLFSAPLFKVTSSFRGLFVMSLSICKPFHPLVVLPNTLSSITSRSSEPCLRLCPIHLSLRCCTVSMFLFSWTLCSTSSFDTQLRSSPFLSKPRFQYLIVHLCLSSIKGNAPHCTLCYFFPSCIIHFPASSRGATPSNDYSCNYFSSDPICTATIGQRYRRTDGRTGNLR